MHAYALIDAAAVPGIAARLAEHAAGLPQRSLFARQPEAALAHCGPWLLQLPDRHAPALEAWLAAIEHAHAAVAWLDSAHAFETVYAHLQRCLDVRLADGALALLRYWDPRVFRRLCALFDPAQRAWLLGPVLRWRAKLGAQRVDILRDAAVAAPADASPVQLDARQQALLRLPEPGAFAPRLAAEIRRDLPAQVGDLREAQLIEETERSYRHASEQLRIARLSPLVRWVKFDVASRGALRRDLSVGLRFRRADDPALLAEDLLSALAARPRWGQ